MARLDNELNYDDVFFLVIAMWKIQFRDRYI